MEIGNVPPFWTFLCQTAFGKGDFSCNCSHVHISFSGIIHVIIWTALRTTNQSTICNVSHNDSAYKPTCQS